MINTMKKVSRWANKNPIAARIIIASSHLIVVINALCMGTLLFMGDFGESKWLLPIVANLICIAFVFYPNVSKKQKKTYYFQQKAHDFSFVICYAVVISLGFNNFLMQDSREYNLAPQPTAKLIVHKLNPENRIDKGTSSKSEVKEKFKQIKKQVKDEFRKLKKEFKNKNNGKDFVGLKILLFLLTLIVLVILAYLIAILACHISCSGFEAIAVVVLIVGWTGIIWLGVIAVKTLFRSIPKQQKPSKS